jgi:hypothetical protein
VGFGQILYAGDNLGGAEWDRRDWRDRSEIREHVLRLALDVCIKLQAMRGKPLNVERKPLVPGYGQPWLDD